MTYHLLTFRTMRLGHPVSIPQAIALDGNDQGADRIREVLQDEGFSDIAFLESDPALANKFSVYKQSAAAENPSHGYKKLGAIELTWQL